MLSLIDFLHLLPLLSAAVVAVHNPIKLVFVLAGQSNMSGRGGVSDSRWDHVVPPECRQSPSILRFSAALKWQMAREPLHDDIDFKKTCGVGPGMPFAHSIVAASAAAVPLGLVPCAVGGTRIREWARGTSLYKNLVRRARVAAASAGGRVAAMLWYQGESDTVTEKDAEAYGHRLVTLISHLRADLRDPDLLVIQVALASGEGNYTEIVRDAQKRIRLHHVLCVDAKSLPLEADNLHLTTRAQVELGKMLAIAYLNHTRCNSHFLFDL
ncbi:hypothetical protein HPP92_014606 [Vanilla planifolia]|uniref:Sialate O-acetylesterase domain-containing protein n=1 Tax=Vanilla planifolia TaxID=51239 RepID=A0A835UR95_VANPL|nr:hypothetical protein HPP92_014606 [Vanilla planifolia]